METDPECITPTDDEICLVVTLAKMRRPYPRPFNPLEKEERIALEKLRASGLAEQIPGGWNTTPAGDWVVTRMINTAKNWRKAFGER